MDEVQGPFTITVLNPIGTLNLNLWETYCGGITHLGKYGSHIAKPNGGNPDTYVAAYL